MRGVNAEPHTRPRIFTVHVRLSTCVVYAAARRSSCDAAAAIAVQETRFTARGLNWWPLAWQARVHNICLHIADSFERCVGISSFIEDSEQDLET
jgi:hypothetical protein